MIENDKPPIIMVFKAMVSGLDEFATVSIWICDVT